MTIRDLQNVDELVNAIAEDISEIPDDTTVTYEVWAIGYDEEDCVTDAELLLGTFDDPDFAVSYAKAVTLADVVNLMADEDWEIRSTTGTVDHISIEVETVVPDDEGTMNIGTIYEKTLEVFDNLPEFIALSNSDYEIMEDGDIQIPCNILKDYNKNDLITIVFEDDNLSQPMIYKIISKTTSGHYICEFM